MILAEWSTPVTDTEVRTLELAYWPNKTVWAYVHFEADGVALTPIKVLVNEDGYVTEDIDSGSELYMVGVPDVAKSTGTIDWIQVGGPVSSMVVSSLSITKGHAAKIDGAAVATTSDTAITAASFGIARETVATSSAVDMFLIPKYITAEA